MKYTIVIEIEKGQIGYGAYVPDLPGCVALGETIAEVRALIQEAIEVRYARRAAYSCRVI